MSGPLSWDGVGWTRRPVDQASTVDLFGNPLPVRDIGLGWWVTSRTLVDADGYPRGGIVVDILTDADPDTGELLTRWVCVALVGRGGDVARVVIDHPVDVLEARPARPGELADMANICHRVLGRAKTGKRSAHEQWVAHVAHRLDGLLFLVAGGAA